MITFIIISLFVFAASEKSEEQKKYENYFLLTI